MKTRILLPALVFVGLLAAVPHQVQAQTTGTTDVTLQTTDYLQLLDNTATLDFTPTASEMEADEQSTEKTGSDGIQLRLRTNSLNGASIFVAASDVSDRSSGLLPSDIAVRSTTEGGVPDYFPLTISDQLIWSVPAPKPEYDTVPDPIQVDVKLCFLRAYGLDSKPSNLLTFTAVADVGEGD